MRYRKLFLRLLPCLFLGSLMLTSCELEDLFPTVDEAMLYGTWVASDNSQEHWRFDSDHGGETWDASEDVQEGEGTNFNWSVYGDQLQLDLYGEMGQHVYYDYTIIAQSESSFTWRDNYGDTRTFVKD